MSTTYYMKAFVGFEVTIQDKVLSEPKYDKKMPVEHDSNGEETTTIVGVDVVYLEEDNVSGDVAALEKEELEEAFEEARTIRRRVLGPNDERPIRLHFQLSSF